MDFACQEGQLSEKHKFIFILPFPYSGASELGKVYANFSGEIVTSSSVLVHRDIIYSLRADSKGNSLTFRREGIGGGW